MKHEHFVNCDWGTSHFRLRLVDRHSAVVLNEYRSQQGTGRLAAQTPASLRASAFRNTFCQGLEGLAAKANCELAHLPVVVSGMASSSIGWQEVPYAPLPFSLDGRNLVWRNACPIDDVRHPAAIFLLSGVRSDRDVMRGEETEAIGAGRLSGMSELLEEAVLVLPGTHSKHLRIVHGRIVDFCTYMTGELFELLGRKSSLQHSTGQLQENVSQAVALTGPLVEPFCEGVDEGAHRPLPAALFQVRTRQLLDDNGPAANTAFLSGLLIGAELASIRQEYPATLPIVLGAGPSLHEPYRTALGTLGLGPRSIVLCPDDVDRLSALGQAFVLERLLATADR